MISVSQAFDQAVQQHQAGNLRQAERLYRQVLELDPRHAEALHYLGLAAMQNGRLDQAVQCLTEALAVRPDYADARNNLGVAFHKQQKLTEAESSLRQALRLKPDCAEAHNNLGNVLRDQGRFDEAVVSYRAALLLKPGNAEACCNLGIVLHEQKKLDEAAASFREALRLNPNYADARGRLGNVLAEQGIQEAGRRLEAGDLGQAEILYRQVLHDHPGHIQALRNLGVIAHQLGKDDEAVDYLRQAIALLTANGESRHAQMIAEIGRQMGVVQGKQGKLAEAEACFRHALRLRPDHAAVHNDLGNVLRELGRLEEAVHSYEEALRIQQDYAEAHSNLGLAQLGLEHTEAAVASFAQALRLKPDFAAAHFNYGIALRKQGKIPEALASYQQAVRLQPDFAEAHNDLGICLQDQGELEQARDSYQRATQLKLNLAAAHKNLGTVLSMLGYQTAAIASFRNAVRLEPDKAELHDKLGIALLDQGKLDEAEGSLQEALRLQPDLADAHCGLGVIREERGDFAQAQICQRQALQHDPGQAYAWSKLAGLLRDKLSEDDLSAMRTLLATADMADEARAALHFGLAEVLDARKSYDAAAEHLSQANACALRDRQRRRNSYVPEQHTWWIDQACATFTPAFFEGVRGFGVETERPVFIVGLPRSGTTLTEQILAGHSQVFGAGELRLARDGFTTLTGGDASYRARDPRAFEKVARVDAAAIQRLAQTHLQRLGELDPRAVRIVDKMPDNYMHLGFLAALFPRAKFIHCRRDVRDVAVSCWMTHFRQIPWSNDFDHIASRFNEYQRIMNHWQKALPVPLLEIWYEETVADVEGMARRLTAWCGLDWEPACLKFYEGKRQVHTASMTQVRQPIYTRSAGRWRNYEKSLGPLFAKLMG